MQPCSQAYKSRARRFTGRTSRLAFPRLPCSVRVVVRDSSAAVAAASPPPCRHPRVAASVASVPLCTCIAERPRWHQGQAWPQHQSGCGAPDKRLKWTLRAPATERAGEHKRFLRSKCQDAPLLLPTRLPLSTVQVTSTESPRLHRCTHLQPLPHPRTGTLAVYQGARAAHREDSAVADCGPRFRHLKTQGRAPRPPRPPFCRQMLWLSPRWQVFPSSMPSRAWNLVPQAGLCRG